MNRNKLKYRQSPAGHPQDAPEYGKSSIIYQIQKVLGEGPQTHPTPSSTPTFAQIEGGGSLCFFAQGDSSSQSIPVLMQFIM